MTRAHDEEAAHIGARSFTRPWWVKLLVLAVFAAAVVLGVGLASLVK